MAEGDVKHLYTKGLRDASAEIKSKVEEFNEAKNNIDRATRELLSTWVGEGRNSFETQYAILFRQLGDIGDELYDIYQSLVDSEATYISADEETKKQIILAKG